MNSLRFLSAVVLSTPLAVMAAPPTFLQPSVQGAFQDVFDIAVEDFNGDSFLDLVATEPNTGDVILVTSSGGDLTSGTQQTIIDSSAAGAAEVEVGDVDGDGDFDVFVAATEDNDIIWYENPQNGVNTVWVQHDIELEAPGVVFIEPADMDGDGALDVVASVPGNEDDEAEDLIWFRNPGLAVVRDAESWDRIVIDPGVPEISGVAIADIDEDGDPDVVVNEFGSGTILWYRNPGGTLATTADFQIIEIGNRPENFFSAVGDFDSDGDLDVAVVGQNRVSLHFNISDVPGEEWTAIQFPLNLSLLSGVSRIDSADFDADGDLDLVVSATNTDDIIYFENPGSTEATVISNWSFESIADPANPGDPLGIAVADFDGNGSTDFAVALSQTDEIRLFLNQSAVVAPGSPVISTITTVDGGGFEITFDAVAGVVYRIDSSTNLTFPDSSLTDGGVGTAMDPATAGPVTVPLALQADQPRLFYRVVVVSP